MLKTLYLIISILLWYFSYPIDTSANANETLKVDRDFAITREIEIDVASNGLAIDFGSTVSAVNLYPTEEIGILGLDGVLCQNRKNCPEESAPTILILRKIPTIDFPEQESNPDGTVMLFVQTDSGLYRFEINPINREPKYTKVEIRDDPIRPLFSGDRSTTPLR